MNQYCDYKAAFSSKENDKLDKLAKEYNNKNKKIQKQTEMEFETQQKELCVGLDCMMDPANIKYAPPNFSSNFGYFSTQGDFSSKNKLPTPLNSSFGASSDISSFDSAKSNSSSSNSEVIFDTIIPSSDFVASETMSFGTSGLSFDDMTSFSSLPQNLKKKIKQNNSHLKKYGDNDSEVFVHTQKCEQCKNQLINLLHGANFNNNVPQKPVLNNQDNDTNYVYKGMMNINLPEFKDVLILILIGIFIIVMLDIFMK